MKKRYDIHCICHRISIERIARIALANNYTINDMQKRRICATKCKLCIPYIEEKIKKV